MGGLDREHISICFSNRSSICRTGTNAAHEVDPKAIERICDSQNPIANTDHHNPDEMVLSIRTYDIIPANPR
jgi:hypothetical protein